MTGSRIEKTVTINKPKDMVSLLNNNDGNIISLENFTSDESVKEACNYVIKGDAYYPPVLDGNTFKEYLLRGKQPDPYDVQGYVPLTDEEKSKRIAAILVGDYSVIREVLKIHCRINAWTESDLPYKYLLMFKKRSDTKEDSKQQWMSEIAKDFIYMILQENNKDNFAHRGVPMADDKKAKILRDAIQMMPQAMEVRNVNLPNEDICHLTISEEAKKSILHMLSSVSAHVDYINAKMKDNPVDEKNVTNIRERIEATLANSHSPFSKFLRELPQSKKINFITALVSNNQKEIAAYIIESPLKDMLENSELKDISSIAFYLKSDNPGLYLNSTIKAIIQNILNGPDGKKLHDDTIARILTNAMVKIPDDEMSVRVKSKVCLTIEPSTGHLFLGYNEYVKEVQKTEKATNLTLGLISKDEYQTAVSSKNIEYSQFILLTLGVLQDRDPEIENIIKQIHKDYMVVNYEAALTKIEEICNTYRSAIERKDPGLTDIILQRLKSLDKKTNEVDLKKNFVRRFLEAQVAAQYYSHIMVKPETLESINKVARFFLPNYEDAKNLKEAIKTITAIPEIKHMRGKEKIEAREEDLKSKHFTDEKWKDKKGRLAQPDHYSLEVLPALTSGTVIEKVETQNLGTLNSITPTYPDQRSEHAIRGAQADSNTLTDPNNPKLYPVEYQRSVYLASISGHTYYMVAMLEYYMNANPGLDHQKDMNNFMQAWVATYVGQGYHSYLECMHVLQAPAVQEIFNSHGMKIEEWPESLLDQAFRDTQTFTSRISLQASVRQSLLSSNKDLFEAINNSDEKKVLDMIAKNPSLINIDGPNGTPFEIAIKNASWEIVMLMMLYMKEMPKLDKKTQAKLDDNAFKILEKWDAHIDAVVAMIDAVVAMKDGQEKESESGVEGGTSPLELEKLTAVILDDKTAFMKYFKKYFNSDMVISNTVIPVMLRPRRDPVSEEKRKQFDQKLHDSIRRISENTARRLGKKT